MLKTKTNIIKSHQRIFGTTIILGLITAILALIGTFDRFDLTLSDVRINFAQVEPSDKTVIVAIDQKSVVSLGGYPLSRSVLADALQKIKNAGPNKTYLDVSFGYPGPKTDDDRLEAVLKSFSSNSFALPATNFSESNDDGTSRIVEIQSLPKFSNHAKTVSGDIFLSIDGKSRQIGNIHNLDIRIRPTAAAWLNESNSANPNSFKIDFGINRSNISTYSLVDILNGTVSASLLSEKNVIVGLTTGGATQMINAPRYGNLQRPELLALATETLQLKRNISSVSKKNSVAIALIISFLLSFWLLRYNAKFGALIALTSIMSTFSLAVYLRSSYLIDLPIAVIILSILFTYIGVQANIHPSFARLRHALKAFLDKIDFSHLRLMHSGNDAIVTFTPEGVILTMNGAAEEMFELIADECIGRSIYAIMPEHAERLLAQVAGQQPGRLQVQLSEKNDSSQHIDMSYNALPTDEGWVGLVSIRDITEMKSVERKLSYAATHDALTGLSNRAGFNEHLKATTKFCADTNQSFAVLLIDLDKFKQVNDTLGHHVGDAVLEGVSNRISKTLRKSDFAARLGGDEFAIIMTAPVEIGNAEKLATKLVDLVSQPIECDGVVAKVGASIGIALYGLHADTPDILVQRADEAMYQAKKQGRNGFAVANPIPDFVSEPA